MSFQATDGYQNLNVFFGDLHNHCGLSYGHGSFDEAVKNARLQLDFVSVTLHAVWPDIPEEDARLGYLVDYHKMGFAKAHENWQKYLEAVEAHHQPGDFITFPSYEWHSNQFGDHCIYYKFGAGNPILHSNDITGLRNDLKELSTPSLLIPHHIGYRQGYRGINWAAFSSELSPVVEIFSFHGSSESSEGPYPYLHSMGPRHHQSCAQYGWAQGHIFGVVGSTDHHNAFPGSYGSGRLGVWAKSLTRDHIWEAILNRRTYALTGDRIRLTFSLNDQPMGAVCPPDPERTLQVSVEGGDQLDTIDILHNNVRLHRECPLNQASQENTFKVFLELGWGEKPEETFWNVDFQIRNGRLIETEPRFRGFGSQGNPQSGTYAYIRWEETGPNQIQMTTQTRPNPSLHTPATEGMSFEIQGDPETVLHAVINGTVYEHTLGDLMQGSRTHYLGGFVSPAICFHQAVPRSQYVHAFSFTHHAKPKGRDWYYVRVRQRNGQSAWSSPIWIEKPSPGDSARNAQRSHS